MYIKRTTMQVYQGMLITLFAIAISACSSGDNKTSEAKQPNIIFIFSDDHAYQAIGAYGNPYAKTPNIDRIAQEGAIFNNFLVTNSICGPSRATLLTGKYSHANGYKVNERDFDMTQQVFSRLLKQNDYQTAWIGKWHLGSLPGDAFDYWNILPGQGHYYNPDFISFENDTIRKEGYVTDIITELATSWLDQRDDSKPFFLAVAEKATHREWLPDLQDLGAYDAIDFPLPETFYDNYEGRKAAANQDMTIDKTMRLKQDLKVHLDYDRDNEGRRFTAEQKARFSAYYDKVSQDFDEQQLTGKALVEWKFQRYLKDYYATANSLDRNIGKLLDYLDESGLAENTIVIYCSDQGFYLGEHGWFDKRFIYKESLKTPFVIRYPGVVEAGTKIDQHVVNIDWAPTLLHMAGVSVPEDIQGESFLPLLAANGKDVKTRDASYYHYYEFPQPHHVSPHFGITTEQYKLVRFYGGQEAWELFDKEGDPNETKNRYGDPQYKAVIDELKAQLRELIEQYSDEEAKEILDQETATLTQKVADTACQAECLLDGMPTRLSMIRKAGKN